MNLWLAWARNALIAWAALTLFAGVHRGWAPPRTKDAVSSTGGTVTLEAESSWNSEIGARLTEGDLLYSELALFRLDFDNQVIDPAESAGAVVSSATVQGGSTLHQGVELGLRLDPLGEPGGLGLPMSLNYTFVRAEFGDGWGDALLGQTLPYAPAHELQLAVGGLDKDLRAAIGKRRNVYLLISNTPDECVVGGDRAAAPKRWKSHCIHSRQVPLITAEPAGARSASGPLA